MLKPDQIIALSKLNNRNIAAVIKTAGAILTSGHAVSESTAKALLKLDDLGWTMPTR